jgi:lantibiotic modifying enzyme
VSTQRLIADGLAFARDTMTPDSSQHLWRSQRGTENFDPCAVQHGGAGVLALLVRAAQVLDERHFRGTIRTATGWIDRRMRDAPRLLPGLYFGHSGTAWALHETACLLEDDELSRRAVSLAKKLPLRWPNPDICHGTAGSGMAQLYFWQATGDLEFAERARSCADIVLAGAEPRDEGVVWPIPATFDSALAGVTHYGFAHGVAGIGTFLLLAARSLDRAEYLEVAREAGRTLTATASIADGAAWWRSGEGADDREPRLTHWCSGSSGVGTFLVRLWQATNDPDLRAMAEQAASAVRRNRWNASTVACHGLAGDGEFLLDLADILGEARYRTWAGELLECLRARNVLRSGRILLPDESGLATAIDYGTGMAGILAFLLRLRHGGSRLWIPEPRRGAPMTESLQRLPTRETIGIGGV